MQQTDERPPIIYADDDIVAGDPDILGGAECFERTDVSVKTLFDYLASGYSLHIFLKYHPAVTRSQALAAIDDRARKDASAIVCSHLDFISGTPRFAGTRVPVKNLFDYIEGGYDLDEFLLDFPTVEREQAVAAFGAARKAMERYAYEAAAR
jgi:uncharacterized protein (DUF433 family)